jgi:integrase
MVKTKYRGVYYRDTKSGDRVYYITYKISGKMHRDKVGTNKEGITAAYASKIRSKRTSVERLRDDAPMTQNTKMPLFDECFEEYYKKIEGKSDAHNIKRRYEIHVQPVFGNLLLDEITSDMVENFKRESMKQVSQRTGRPYAAKTMNDWIDIIGTVYNFMINKYDMKIKNPAHGSKVERQKVDNDRERYLEIEEIKMLWDELESRVGSHYKEYVTENMKVFLALSLSTGARVRSVLTITKADVNLRTNTITIKNHKSNRTYNGYLHPRYREIIETRMKKLSPIDYLVNKKKSELNRSNIYKVFSDIFNRLFNEGLDAGDAKRRVVTHTLRHTFASQLAIQGTPIYTIMRLMDHADISQTIRYAKLSPDSAKESVFSLKI